MHDSDDDLRLDNAELVMSAARRSLEQLEALQSLELQHLNLRIERQTSKPPSTVERHPDAFVRPRRAA